MAPRGSHKTITRHQEDQKKQRNQLSLLIAKLEWTQSNAQKHRTIIESHNGSNNQQRINNNRTTALEWRAA